ncbi:sulfate/molybdate ABC transporter ATP-binding protein [Aneurinibacillus sp. Ricciae_BoGa-3]|uniref:sulfate/molybdate ABC transporter ATP-binding protein n=1 Tax=Aneurinibacillus sp. Ricciae_BoGa-3 TaxID=3022697 RepID=UPI002340DADE|nr:sulfate/molybdate ABC transporter ATP-binding protein [Aneurinibacillus sp. Ricciae_BoGa-3]WCK56779.1 sulfate/molybdate ABC transporter ATP-binding protein [Aneurinibacillus sp. Ricciae_BoGa-3]
MNIELLNLSKNFHSLQALQQIQFDIKKGELIALIGPSGSGKTTLLRILGGMEQPDEGQLLFDGADPFMSQQHKPNVGFVFQHYALFKHMNVFENIAFGLRVRPRKQRPSKKEIRAKVEELLHIVEMSGLEKRYPSQLSGGQRQRVALARALAIDPGILLLDEPFGALDAQVRQNLRRWLRELHDRLQITTVFVTHDQEEALEVADRVVILNKGKIEQIGTPEEVYSQPANPFVYSFLGRVNQIEGEVANGYIHVGPVTIKAESTAAAHCGPAVGFVRPHEILISRQPKESGLLSAFIHHIQHVGDTVRIELKRHDNDEALEAEISTEQQRFTQYRIGEAVSLTLQNLRFFMRDNGNEKSGFKEIKILSDKKKPAFDDLKEPIQATI